MLTGGKMLTYLEPTAIVNHFFKYGLTCQVLNEPFHSIESHSYASSFQEGNFTYVSLCYFLNVLLSQVW